MDTNYGESLEDEMSNIEGMITAFFLNFRRHIPELHKISFEIDYYKHSREIKLHGFYHIGESCESYVSMDDLRNPLLNIIKERSKKEILFRRFNV